MSSYFMSVGEEEITSDREAVIVERLEPFYENFNREDIMNVGARLYEGFDIYTYPANSFEFFLSKVDSCLICDDPLINTGTGQRVCQNENCAGRGLTSDSLFYIVDQVSTSTNVQLGFEKIMQEITGTPKE